MSVKMVALRDFVSQDLQGEQRLSKDDPFEVVDEARALELEAIGCAERAGGRKVAVKEEAAVKEESPLTGGSTGKTEQSPSSPVDQRHPAQSKPSDKHQKKPGR